MSSPKKKSCHFFVTLAADANQHAYSFVLFCMWQGQDFSLFEIHSSCGTSLCVCVCVHVQRKSWPEWKPLNGCTGRQRNCIVRRCFFPWTSFSCLPRHLDNLPPLCWFGCWQRFLWIVHKIALAPPRGTPVVCRPPTLHPCIRQCTWPSWMKRRT